MNGIKNLDETMFEKDQLKGLIPLLPSKEDVRMRVGQRGVSRDNADKQLVNFIFGVQCCTDVMITHLELFYSKSTSKTKQETKI